LKFFFVFTFDERAVLTQVIKDSLSLRLIVVEIDLRTFNASSKAIWNPSEIVVGWIPLARILSQACNKEPAITTTEVVPSPASIS